MSWTAASTWLSPESGLAGGTQWQGQGPGALGIATLWLDGDAPLSFWVACLRGNATLPLSSCRETLKLAVEPRSLLLNDGYSAGVGLEGWPRFVYPGWLTGLLTLGVPLDLSLHVAPEDTGASVRRLEWRRVQLESSRALALKRGKTTAPEEELAMEDLARLRDDLQRGRERLFLASLALVVRGAAPDDLDRHLRQVQAQAAGSLATLRVPAFRQRQAHLATLPMALNPLGNWKRVDTSSLACLFPFTPPDLDTRQGFSTAWTSGRAAPPSWTPSRRPLTSTPTPLS